MVTGVIISWIVCLTLAYGTELGVLPLGVIGGLIGFLYVVFFD